jgi:hypothetical protein
VTNPEKTPMSLVDELTTMHASYVAAINAAVAHDNYASAEQLARDYDDEAIQLIAAREGKTHLLPITRGHVVDTPLRTLVARLRATRAA